MFFKLLLSKLLENIYFLYKTRETYTKISVKTKIECLSGFHGGISNYFRLKMEMS